MGAMTSKNYICPNTGTMIWVEYDEQRLMLHSPDEYYPVALPLGLLIRVLGKEPRLREHVLSELEHE